jgi:hypothetical protein
MNARERHDAEWQQIVDKLQARIDELETLLAEDYGVVFAGPRADYAKEKGGE